MTRHRGGGRGPARAQTRARAALSGLCVTGSPVEWVGGVCPSWGASRDRSSENKRLRAASCGGPDHRPELSLTCAPEHGRSPYRHFQSLPPSQETAHSLGDAGLVAKRWLPVVRTVTVHGRAAGGTWRPPVTTVRSQGTACRALTVPGRARAASCTQSNGTACPPDERPGPENAFADADGVCRSPCAVLFLWPVVVFQRGTEHTVTS